MVVVIKFEQRIKDTGADEWKKTIEKSTQPRHSRAMGSVTEHCEANRFLFSAQHR